MPDTAPAARRILVVEDLTDARESLRELVEIALGLDVDTAEDGAQALKMVVGRPYSLILTDLRMPRGSGLHLLRGMRERELAVPVIVITGNGTVKEAVEAMKLGARDFLTKPLDPQQLLALVESALRERAGS